MNATQEPKYKIENGKLVNRSSGEQIPDDEPVFVLRARDKHAAATLASYSTYINGTDEHSEAVHLRIRQFEKWSKDHPERMKEPDTTLTSDWDNL